MSELNTEERISYLQAILWDPDLPRFYSDERIAELEMELEELKSGSKQ